MASGLARAARWDGEPRRGDRPRIDVRPPRRCETRDHDPRARGVRRIRSRHIRRAAVTSTYAVRSRTSTTRTRSGPPGDVGLLDWVRHYWFVLLLVTALGAAGSGAVWWFATPRFEMWTTL